MALAQSLAAQGVAPVWSGSAQEAALIAAIDPQGQFASCAGTLSLAQLWHLLQGAALLVVPDTGIAHLAKLTGTPTVCLFGPGSDVLFGAGRFWRKHRFVPVIEADFPCRDQRTLFGRRIEWVRRCQRSTAQCPAPACMHALDTDRVIAACRQLLGPA
jgi:ADP-heptose:LPS heptosyltransferase